MLPYKVDFEALPWLEQARGIRCKVQRCGGSRLRLVQYDRDLDPHWATSEVVESLLRTFLNLGGQIFQGNTTDVKELIAAQKDPEAYPNLMVRVGGFSARFTGLSSQLQDEIVQRYRHTA